MEDYPKKSDKELIEERDNKYRRITIIFFSILIILLIIFFILFFLIKCNEEKKDNSSEPTPVSVAETSYINFYNHMLSTTNEYMETYFSRDNYANYINAVSYENNSLSYTCMPTSKDEVALFTFTCTYSSLEEVIKSYNDNELDLYSLPIEVEIYNKDDSETITKKTEFRGKGTIHPGYKSYSVTYKEDGNDYVSAIYLFDDTNNLVYSNKTVVDFKNNPHTYSLFKFIIQIA